MAKPKILTDIEELKKGQLTGKYYIPTVSRTSTGNITVTANPLPTSWTGSGLSYSSGSYTIETNMTPLNSANILSDAFDNNNNTRFFGIYRAYSENYIILTLPEAIEVASFHTYIPNTSQNLDKITILGSNDKSSWHTLYVYDSFDTNVVVRMLTTIAKYKYYKFLFDTRGNVEVIEIKLGEYKIPNYKNTFSLAGVPNPLGTNQRIMIKTPDFSSTGVTSNTLNGKNIDMVLLPNRYYELVYNGSIYLAKEVV